MFMMETYEMSPFAKANDCKVIENSFGTSMVVALNLDDLLCFLEDCMVHLMGKPVKMDAKRLEDGNFLLQRTFKYMEEGEHVARPWNDPADIIHKFWLIARDEESGCGVQASCYVWMHQMTEHPANELENIYKAAGELDGNQ